MSESGSFARYPDQVLSARPSAILIADIVDSVRLHEENETVAVARWMRFVHRVAEEILPDTGSRLVKSTGDGFLLAFENVRDAVSVAFAIQRASSEENSDLPDNSKLLLRIGIETGKVFVGRDDVYGIDVNRAARLATLSGPGEIVVSARVRDQITASLDAEPEDMGENYLKGIREPVRAYRLTPPGAALVRLPAGALDELLPTVAVVPFSERMRKGEQGLGDVIAEEVIVALSRGRHVNVISRLSTAGFRDRANNLRGLYDHLNARFAVTGTYWQAGSKVFIDVELSETRTGKRLWGDRFESSMNSILEGQIEAVDDIVANTASTIVKREIHRARTQAMPTLESYSLLMAAISLTQRFSKDDFLLAKSVLDELIQRASRHAAPYAWLAYWHTQKVQQGWSSAIAEDFRAASVLSSKALDLDPTDSLSLTMAALAETVVNRDFATATAYYDEAVSTNPSDAFAWVMRAAMLVVSDRGEDALESALRSLRLSPRDPQAYFQIGMVSSAHFVMGDFEKAIENGTHSLRLNRRHASTLRNLAASYWYHGQTAKARAIVSELLELTPGFSIRSYRQNNPSAATSVGERMIRAFEGLGIPAE